MHEMLLAESTLERLHDEFTRLEGITYVTVNPAGELKRDGQPVSVSDLNLTMLRLDVDLFLADRQTAIKLMTDTPRFKFVQTVAAGMDDPMFPMLVGKSDVFCNSDAQAPAIAEFCVASVLNRWQRFDERDARHHARQWQTVPFRQVLGSHWLIIGFGNIGQRIAEQVKGFGAEVTGIRRNLAPHPHADRLATLEDLHKFLPEADAVILSCALNDTTRDLADAAFFRAMKNDAVLVNIGRGELLDEDALLTALDEGQLGYAALDVFRTEPLPEDSPLWAHDRIRVTPHDSHAGNMTGPRFDALFMSNLRKYLAGEEVTHRVTSDFFD